MNKLFNNQKVISVIQMTRPWITCIAIFLILRYTGMLASLSGVTGNAMLKTGILDVDTDIKSGKAEPFNYDFTIKRLDGKAINFNQFKGKTVFLNLWATWCGPCRAEMPSIQSLYSKVDKEKVAFVILDWFEDAKKTSAFIDAKKYSFPVYLIDHDVPEQLKVASIPTTFVINAGGKIVSQKTGTANYDTEEFKRFLEGLK